MRYDSLGFPKRAKSVRYSEGRLLLHFTDIFRIRKHFCYVKEKGISLCVCPIYYLIIGGNKDGVARTYHFPTIQFHKPILKRSVFCHGQHTGFFIRQKTRITSVYYHTLSLTTCRGTSPDFCSVFSRENAGGTKERNRNQAANH